ncbi:MAG: hypothetical protein AB7S92_21825 [Parvibaculaceae bacterium]
MKKSTGPGSEQENFPAMPDLAPRHGAGTGIISEQGLQGLTGNFGGGPATENQRIRQVREKRAGNFGFPKGSQSTVQDERGRHLHREFFHDEKISPSTTNAHEPGSRAHIIRSCYSPNGIFAVKCQQNKRTAPPAAWLEARIAPEQLAIVTISLAGFNSLVLDRLLNSCSPI